MQERLARIWSEVLGVPRVGIHDNFFELGGDSILIIVTVSRANREGLKMTPQQMFERQTVAALAEVAGETIVVETDQGPVTGSAPLTPIQRWFFSQPLDARHHFNQSVMLEIPESVETEVLREAVKSLIEHHDALRLRFTERNGLWEQQHAPAGGEVPFGVTVSDDETAIHAQAAQLQASLHLAEGPLLRVQLFRSALGLPSRLLVIVHHLAVDGVSWRVLFEDLALACRQIGDGQPVNLPAKTSSFQECARRLESFSRTHVANLNYWLDEQHWQAPRLPVDRTVPPEANTISSVAEVTISLDEDLTRSLLQDAPKAFNTQIDDILLTALLLAFREWTGQPRLLVDLEGHGREDLFEGLDLSRTVGWFTSLYPVRLEIGQETAPGAALKSVKEQLRAVPLGGLEYGIARYLGEDRDVRDRLSSRPSAEVLFNYLGQTDRVLAAGADWKPMPEFKSPEQSPLARRAHLLEIVGIVFDGRLRLTWSYSQMIHDRAVIERLAKRYTGILQALIEDCRSSHARGFTPSDFPAARIDQRTLDALVAEIE